MPKSPNSPIRMYFIIQPRGSNGSVNPESECKACGLKMKGIHASNMERHVRRSHPQIYEKYLELKQKTNSSKRNCEWVNSQPQWVNSQTFTELDVDFNPSDFIKIKKIKTASGMKLDRPSSSSQLADRQAILDACIELVTVNGRPFSVINDSGFQTLVQLAYGKAHPPLSINDELIKDLVSENAASLKNTIQTQVKHKILCLRLDISTHCHRSFLGISVQFYEDGNVVSFMLAVIEVNVRDEANELDAYILKELDNFGICKKQIYCVVIACGSNFIDFIETDAAESEVGISKALVCSSTDVSDICQAGSGAQLRTFDESNLDLKSSFSLNDDVEASVQVITVFNETEDDDNDLDWNTTEIIAGKLHLDGSEETRTDSQFIAFEMRCVADTLQWAICDALKSSEEMYDVVKDARTLLQKLNSPTYRTVLQKMNFHRLTISSVIRWRSVYLALEKLVSLKDVCAQLPVIFKSSSFWENVDNFLTSLKPCKSVSDTLQKEQLTIGDVFKLWFNCILETSKINSAFAQTLVKHMRQKQDSLFNDDTFVAAIFLDPRFNNMVLKEVHKTRAVEYLIKLYQKLSYDSSEDSDFNNQMSANDEEDELEKIFREQEHFNDSQRQVSNNYKFIEIALRNFCDNEPRLKTSESVINFWEKKKTKYPDVYRLACVILSTSAVQRSTTKLLCQMRYALSPHGINMNRDIFDDIILIRSNSDL